MKKTILIVLLSICLLFANAIAGQITLAWDPPTEGTVTGYKLYAVPYDQEFDYASPVYDGPATIATIEVPIYTELKFIVRAYLNGDAGQVYESGDSNMVVWAIVQWTDPNLRVQ